MTSKQYLIDSRRAAMISQATLAYHLGVSQQVVSQWETGKIAIPYYRTAVICEIIGAEEEKLKKLLNSER